MAVSLSHDKKNEETPRPSAKILTYKKSVEKSIKIILYDRVKAPLTSSVYYYNHLLPLPA